MSYHSIIWRYDVHMSNRLSDIEQNHWTMTAQITVQAYLIIMLSLGSIETDCVISETVL